MTIPRNPVRVKATRVHGWLLWQWSCRSCRWVSVAHPSPQSVGTHAHQHARTCRDAS